MSYIIEIRGEHEAVDFDDGKAFDEALAAKAREFVSSLDGVVTAEGKFGHVVPQDLTEAQ